MRRMSSNMASHRPICQDFLRGKCKNPVCNHAHESPVLSSAPTQAHQIQRAEANQNPTETEPESKQPQTQPNKEMREEGAQGLKNELPLRPPVAPRRMLQTPEITDSPGGRHNNDFDDICRIKIMPSYDEIRCSRPEYLPTVDPTQWHLEGAEGLLDRNFRLLREDTVGQIRDTVRHVMFPNANQTPPLRSFMHRNVRILKPGVNWLAGLYVEVDFPQPEELRWTQIASYRKKWWELSKRFSPGDLVCLVIQNDLVLFCTVANQIMLPRRKHSHDPPQRAESTSLWNDQQRASVKLTLFDSRFTNVQLILDLYGLKEPPITVIGFPGVLVASFEPSLRALQSMKSSKSLPFSEIFAPWTKKSSISRIPSPLQISPVSHAYNLRCLLDTNVDFLVRPGQYRHPEVDYLQQHSNLDYGQAYALINCLNRPLGLVQGPPGTGKSYTGEALIKVLLANRQAGNLGPILCVTYTNHALDQLLEALLDHKVTSQIVRVGSQSKSEKLEEFSLHKVSRQDLKTKGEKRELWSTSEKLSSYELEFQAIGLERDISIDNLRAHMKQRHVHHYNQLFLGVSPSSMESWIDRGVRSHLTPRSTVELENVDASDMTWQERLNMFNQWRKECRENVNYRVTKLVESHAAAKSRYESVHDNMDLRCLLEADIIGVTTSGLARRLDLFQQIPCKFLICEEAGEILEPHLLTAFLPSIKHAVLIGDQQQLRPQVQNFKLSRENLQGGSRYALDISLFERLVSSNCSPMCCRCFYSTLTIQRRMHPEISLLVREAFYPRLTNSLSVACYPEVCGMRRRLFWLDHRIQEDSYTQGDDTSTSHWNDFEAEMAVALVGHLVRQQYDFGDIAVLTPYLGQLNRLKQKLALAFPITVGDRDQDDLAQAGYEGKVFPTASVGKEPQQGALRVATVDNFQGEEAKIVVISLVRSNAQSQCGFLRSSNRINVMLSRAQHGMYIIGNSETSRHVPTWAKVLYLLRQGRNIGPALELQCPRHPNTVINVSMPKVLNELSPEGGCQQRCMLPLKCAHVCPRRCHSETLHDAVICPMPCPRPLRNCVHICPKKCGMACPDKCKVEIPQKGRILACGHSIKILPCWQSQDISTFRCPQSVQRKILGCNHVVSTSCWVDVESTGFRCRAIWSNSLPCGHTCQRECHQCITKESGGIKTDHGACKERCKRKHSTCSHTCSLPCHGRGTCPPCQESCKASCSHSKCQQKCSQPCPPCTELKCPSGCPHGSCSLPCAAPCDHKPCSKPCEKTLRCGHRCPSVCGEKCPPFFCCQLCGNPQVKNREADPILKQKYSDINLNETPCLFPDCGHFLTIDAMDAHMDIASHYEIDAQGKPLSLRNPSTPLSFQRFKQCPTCPAPLSGIARYARINHRASFDESVKKLIVLTNREFVPLAFDLARIIPELGTLKPQNQSAWPMPVEIRGTRWDQVKTMRDIINETNPGKWDEILELREKIERHRRRIQPFEEAFDNFHKLLNRLGHGNTPSSLNTVSAGPRTKGLLQVNALLMCLDLALLASFSALAIKARDSKIRVKVQLDLQTTRDDCQWIINEAKSTHRIFHQAEGHIYLAMVYAFERVHSSSLKPRIVLVGQGQEALVHAKDLCTAHPNQTEGLPYQVNCVDEMLDHNQFYAVVASKKRLADISAMEQTPEVGAEWYYCLHGHSFARTKGGLALKNVACPECGVPLVIQPGRG
ncbi:unnamed protein product [Penicillium olsonii]|nr:unnamed protein product [Penicillium olsonii]